MEVTPEQLWQALMRYDREVVAPRFEQLRSEMVTRDEFLGHMDNIYKQFQRIDTELIAIRSRQ